MRRLSIAFRRAVRVAPCALCCGLFALAGGCRNTGSSIIVGEHFSLPEISDSGDNVSCKLYEDTKGAKIWTRENSEVRIDYTCATTNDYVGIFHTRTSMSLGVTVTPLAAEGTSEEVR